METPSQTVGPFFHFGLEMRSELIDPADPAAIRIGGTVRDGDGEPVSDALIETWQADTQGFGRVPTDGDGRFEIVTVKPGAVDGHAPHIAVSVFARGLLNRVVTRIYFPDETEANDADPTLAAVRDPQQRESLIANQDGDALTFDIHLQGERQTAFFVI